MSYRELEIDTTIDKLERNYQHGYDHVGMNGQHWKVLPVNDIMTACDASISRAAVNDPTVFLSLLYKIIAHQTYHVPVDEDSQISYSRIATMLKEGSGNPRLQKLEDLLNAIGVSLVICRIKDREDDVEHVDLPRACFFQHLVPDSERWPFRETVELLFSHGLQFRIFTIDGSKDNNTLTHEIDIQADVNSKSTRPRDANKSTKDLLSLLKSFNVYAAMRFIIKPVKKR